MPGQEQDVRKGILSIVRSKLPESIPFLLTTKQEERFRYIGGEKMMSELFMLLSVISLIITVLGIYSAITLDTYSRQKRSCHTQNQWSWSAGDRSFIREVVHSSVSYCGHPVIGDCLFIPAYAD